MSPKPAKRPVKRAAKQPVKQPVLKPVVRDPETQTKVLELVPPAESPHEHRFSYDRLNAVWRCACGLTRGEVPPPAMRLR